MSRSGGARNKEGRLRDRETNPEQRPPTRPGDPERQERGSSPSPPLRRAGGARDNAVFLSPTTRRIPKTAGRKRTGALSEAPLPPPSAVSRHTYRLLLAYDGTAYRGWQSQANARTVQGTLLRAAEDLFASAVDIQGAGRTDAGVHALGQTAHLKADKDLPAGVVRAGLNDRLPSNIHVRDVRKEAADFHARHDARARSYLYLLSRERTAFGKRYVWWVRDALDVSAMSRAAERFVGFHDFASFADRRRDASASALVDIRAAEVYAAGSLVILRFLGSHFLWKMVRRMAGILVEIGRGALPERDLPRLLSEPSDLPARCTAPPSGLFLEQVLYEGDGLRPLNLPLLFVATARGDSGPSGLAPRPEPLAGLPRSRPCGKKKRLPSPAASRGGEGCSARKRL